jgi:hypothetical protein
MSSRVKKKALKKEETLHVRHFMGGRSTPEEMHRRFGIRKSCQLCGAPAILRIKTFVLVKDIREKTPEYLADLIASNPAGPTAAIPAFASKWGPALKVGDVGACENCSATAQKLAAHPPKDWPFRDAHWVDIDDSRRFRDKPTVTVPMELPTVTH